MMLQVSGLKAGYQGKTVVDLPSLSLAKGEHCLILGKSGSGKTTLLYALAGLLRPIAGSIRLGEMEMTPLSARALDAFRGQHIGIIYQTLHLVDALSVLENLLLVPYAAGMPADTSKAERLLSALGLYAMRHRLPQALSQGQKQRVAIARAAMLSPMVIVGDEPSSALDDDACSAVMELLRETAAEVGATLVIATHDARIKPHFAKTLTLGEAA